MLEVIQNAVQNLFQNMFHVGTGAPADPDKGKTARTHPKSRPKKGGVTSRHRSRRKTTVAKKRTAIVGAKRKRAPRPDSIRQTANRPSKTTSSSTDAPAVQALAAMLPLGYPFTAVCPRLNASDTVWVGDIGDIREEEDGSLIGWATDDDTMCGNPLEFTPDAFQLDPRKSA